VADLGRSANMKYEIPAIEERGADGVYWIVAIGAPILAAVFGVMIGYAWHRFSPAQGWEGLKFGLPFLLLQTLGCAVSVGYMIASIRKSEEKMVFSFIGGIPSALWVSYVALVLLGQIAR